MAIKKSKRMQTLKKLAEWREREAAAAVSQQQIHLTAEQQQLKNLQSYYQDYLVTIDQQKQLARSELLNYRNFCQQLAHTIGSGKQKVSSMQRELDNRKNNWFLCRNKRQVLEELILRCTQEENHVLQKELEKEIDDIWLAQRHHSQPSP
jgi:flagellar export protein FliJ